jgi:ribosomal protein S18 acetylase RimI-like enzyme
VTASQNVQTPSARESHPLDHVIWASLTGPHAHLAQGGPDALRYPADVSPFVALPPGFGPEAWDALHKLVGSDQVVLFEPASVLDTLPPGWRADPGELVQLVADDRLSPEPDDEAVPLGADDIPEMMALVERTRPGPFEVNTYLLGGYLGIRRNGALVAMAGQRLNPPGWSEISAVCTDPAVRGQGLGARLVRAVADGIRRRGETPFLHAAASNVNAIRLYEALGFVPRLRSHFLVISTPSSDSSAGTVH